MSDNRSAAQTVFGFLTQTISQEQLACPRSTEAMLSDADEESISPVPPGHQQTVGLSPDPHKHPHHYTGAQHNLPSPGPRVLGSQRTLTPGQQTVSKAPLCMGARNALGENGSLFIQHGFITAPSRTVLHGASKHYMCCFT